jgi:Tfp pilus assembly protein PilX
MGVQKLNPHHTFFGQTLEQRNAAVHKAAAEAVQAAEEQVRKAEEIVSQSAKIRKRATRVKDDVGWARRRRERQ